MNHRVFWRFFAILAALAIAGDAVAEGFAGFTGSKGYKGEATYEKMCELWPALTHRGTTVGAKHCRTKFFIEWNGTIRAGTVDTNNPTLDDWREFVPYELTLSFASGEPPYVEDNDRNQVIQRLLDGYLPIAETSWRTGDVEYSMLDNATLLDAEEVATGREMAVALIRLRMKNLTEKPTAGHFWVTLGSRIPLAWKDHVLYDDQGRTRLIVEPRDRAVVRFHDKFVPPSPTNDYEWDVAASVLANVLKCDAELGPNAQADVILKLPYFPVDASKQATLRGMDFDAVLKKEADYWRREVERGMTIETPDPVVNNIFHAAIGHIFLVADKIPETGRVHLKVEMGHQRYTCAMEMMTAGHALDQRGYHQEMEAYLDSHLAWQGSNKPDGDFKSKEGCLMPSSAFEAVHWVPKNGWILWCLAEHYKFTHDRKWLDRVLPNILASCDWINRERNASKNLDENGEKPITYGLLPAGSCTDYSDTVPGKSFAACGHWTTNDASNFQGMLSTVEVLEEIGHPRAKEMRQQTEDYRECIVRSARMATDRAAPIKLPTGEIIPWVPDELGLRTLPNESGMIYGKDNPGWGSFIVYSNAGPATLVQGRVIDANDELIGWSLRFMQEYPLNQYYRFMPEPRPLLTYGATALSPFFDPYFDCYFWRDEIDQYVEALYATLAGTISRGTFSGTDHPYYPGRLSNVMGRDGCNSKVLRRMLVQEDGNDLLLAWAVPRAWLRDGKDIKVKNAATYFGPMGYEIHSNLAQGRIEATIDPPRRNAPADMKLKLRLRHPERKPIQEVLVQGKPWTQFKDDVVELAPASDTPLKVSVVFGQ